MRIGEYELTAVEMGTFRLDGGAMFGHVPKAIWSRYCEADDANRIQLALRCLYVEGMGRRILIDTGIGDKWSDKHIDMFDIRMPDGGADGVLRRKLDIGADQITDVILTHLHFDHAGGATRRNDAGDLEMTFPNAMYHLQRRNLEWAKKPNPKERASYLPENWEPIEAADRFVLYDGSRDILPGITVMTSDGHTEALQVVRVADDTTALYYCADLIPMTTHVRLPFTMGYDNSSLRLIEEKRTLLEAVVNQKGWVYYEHDPNVAASQVEYINEKFQAINPRETL